MRNFSEPRPKSKIAHFLFAAPPVLAEASLRRSASGPGALERIPPYWKVAGLSFVVRLYGAIKTASTREVTASANGEARPSPPAGSSAEQPRPRREEEIPA